MQDLYRIDELQRSLVNADSALFDSFIKMEDERFRNKCIELHLLIRQILYGLDKEEDRLVAAAEQQEGM